MMMRRGWFRKDGRKGKVVLLLTGLVLTSVASSAPLAPSATVGSVGVQASVTAVGQAFVSPQKSEYVASRVGLVGSSGSAGVGHLMSNQAKTRSVASVGSTFEAIDSASIFATSSNGEPTGASKSTDQSDWRLRTAMFEGGEYGPGFIPTTRRNPESTVVVIPTPSALAIGTAGFILTVGARSRRR